MIQKFRNEKMAAEHIVRQLQSKGHTAYFAGGCVRDTLMGNEPKDYDVATDATPDFVKYSFPHTKAVGASFGVIIVYNKSWNQQKWETEVATFREDGEYSDGRRPDSVVFCSAEEDAKRRDFTINGLFMNPLDDNEIIDFVGGRQDLENKVIRAIGAANKRFSEDYLRMIRAMRFAARLGFDIEEQTSEAIIANADKLSEISKERIGMEVMKMFKGKNFARAVKLIQQHKLDGPIVGETSFDFELRVVNNLSLDANEQTVLAAWLIDRAGPQDDYNPLVKKWQQAMKLRNADAKYMRSRLAHAKELTHWQSMTVPKMKRLIAKMDIEQDLILLDAMGAPTDKLREQINAHRHDGIGVNPKAFIDGGVLADNGLNPGPKFKSIIDEAYDRQLGGEFANRREAVNWVKTIEGVTA